MIFVLFAIRNKILILCKCQENATVYLNIGSKLTFAKNASKKFLDVKHVKKMVNNVCRVQIQTENPAMTAKNAFANLSNMRMKTTFANRVILKTHVFVVIKLSYNILVLNAIHQMVGTKIPIMGFVYARRDIMSIRENVYFVLFRDVLNVNLRLPASIVQNKRNSTRIPLEINVSAKTVLIQLLTNRSVNTATKL